jgi:hypothetical protein
MLSVTASIISLTIDTPDEKYFYSKIAAPLTDKEIKFMLTFGIDDGDGLLDMKEFIVLSIIRIGNVPPQIVLDIIKRFKTITVDVANHMIPYESILGYQPSNEPRNRRQKRTRVQHNQSIEIFQDEFAGNETATGREINMLKMTEELTRSPLIETKDDEKEVVDTKDIQLSPLRHDEKRKLPSNLDLQSGVDASQIRSSRMEVETARRQGEAAPSKRRTFSNMFAKSKASSRPSTFHRLNKINAAHTRLVKKKMSFEERSESSSPFSAFITVGLAWIQDPFIHALLVWLVWLLVAATFYCFKMNLSFYRGFYMSVNVGYAIYWSEEESDGVEKAFSICHIIVGQIMASFALAAFGKALTNRRKKWYSMENAKEEASSVRFHMQREGSTVSLEWETGNGDGQDSPSVIQGCVNLLSIKIYYLFSQHKVHIFLFLYLLFGTLWSTWRMGWPLVEGIYFAVTALSTGGHWSIPQDSEDYEYFIVAIYACTGTPIMCLSGGVFAFWLSKLDKASHLQKIIEAPLSLEELEMMNELEIDDGDGFIDESEYVILILVRLKAIRLELIPAILARFRHLDRDNEGAVPYDRFQLPVKTRSYVKNMTAGGVSEPRIT